MSRTETVTDREAAALTVLREMGTDVLEAALIAREVMAAGRGRVKRARKCVELGQEELRRREKTVSFAKAAEAL